MPFSPAADPILFRPGTAVDLLFQRADGSTSGVHPMTSVADDGLQLLAWMPAGTPIRSSVLLDGRDIRAADLAERFRLPRTLVSRIWTGASNLRLIDESHWSSVWWFFDGDSGAFQGWYVNLEIPRGRTSSSVVRTDGVLDVWVEPTGSWRWKDEDEFAAAIQAGRFADGQAEMLRAEGERMIALAEAGTFPFDGSHTDFAVTHAFN